MRLSDILAPERLLLDIDRKVTQQAHALRHIAELVAPPSGLAVELVEQLLHEREQLQSTWIGQGLAIPHARAEVAPGQVAAVLLCPHGVPSASDNSTVARIIFGVVGPKGETAQHLRVLARVSRLLRDGSVREELLRSATPGAAFELIVSRDEDQAGSVRGAAGS